MGVNTENRNTQAEGDGKKLTGRDSDIVFDTEMRFRQNSGLLNVVWFHWKSEFTAGITVGSPVSPKSD